MLLTRLLAGVALSLAVTSTTVTVPSLGAPDVAARELTYYPIGRALNPLEVCVLASRHMKRMTNAERLVRGLPL